MGAAAVVIPLITAAVQAGAQAQAGAAKQKEIDNNLILQGYQRDDAMRRASIAAGAAQAQARKFSAAGVAAAGAGGVSTTSGSVSDLIAQSSVAGSMDEATIRANAARAAWGYDVESQQAMATRSNVGSQSIIGAVGTGISGLGQSVGAYKQYYG